MIIKICLSWKISCKVVSAAAMLATPMLRAVKSIEKVMKHQLTIIVKSQRDIPVVP